MAIIKCKECNKEISSRAKQCPNCGFSQPKSGLFKIIVFIIVALVLFVIIGEILVANQSPEIRDAHEAANNFGKVLRNMK